MSAIRIACPRCGKGLKLASTPAPGKLVYCSGEGGHSFPYLPPAASPSVAEAPAWSLGVPLAYVAGAATLALALGTVLGMRSLAGRATASSRIEASGRAAPPSEPPSSPSQDERPVLARRNPAPDDVLAGVPVSLPPAPPPAQPESSLPKELQDKVNAAIEKGLADLKRTQRADGSWSSGHPAGHTALAGLTMLECGVPADDVGIRKAAAIVHKAIDQPHAGMHTYTASLMLLFLDRLGDPADAKRVRTLSLRLVAGQQGDGGWSYHIPRLTEGEEEKLFTALTSNRPRGLDRIVLRPPGGGLGRIIGAGGGNGELGRIVLGSGVPETAPTAEEEDKANKTLDALPPHLRDIPAFVDIVSTAPPKQPRAGRGRRNNPPRRLRAGRSDNSNTQFAALAMWAALRHGVPMESALRQLGVRFRDSQLPDGGWGYVAQGRSHDSPAMTGVGLLGLAISKGLSSADRKPPARDEGIERGLKALGKNIEPTVHNLYFWWTVERVAMLYGIKQIDGKDWYATAVNLLLEQQKPEGWWFMGHYPGADRTLDTCFALLILKRVNLAPELTVALEGRLVLPK